LQWTFWGEVNQQALEKTISRVLFRAAVTRKRDDDHSSGTPVALRL